MRNYGNYLHLGSQLQFQ